MKRLLMVVVLGLACFGCGNDCDDAADKLEECGFTGGGGDVDSSDCSGASECAAACINDASCDEITGKKTDGNYGKCVLACAGG